MALELITESEADANSYGFRKFRSAADAIDALHRWLSRDCLPQWILEGDIKVYSKFSSGDPDTGKTAGSWFGACVFLIIAATVLRSFFL